MKPTITAQNDALTLRVLKTDKFKAGMLSLSAFLPIDRDSAYLTSLLFSVLMRGTEKYPSLEAINRRLDYLYGTDLVLRNFYRGDLQIVGFAAELLDTAYLPDGDSTADVLEVVEQILFHPLRDENGLLLEKYVESEKKLQCDSIRSLKNNPRVYANEQMRGLLYAGQPCGVPIYGTIEELMAVTPELLTAHWKRLTETLTLDCFYVGSMDENALWEQLCATVGKYTRRRSTALPCACAPIPVRETVQAVCEEIDAGQSQLLMSWRSDKTLNSEGHAARMVLNELFGGSPVSRLFVHVRERLSLCYSCSSSYRSYKGTLLVACGIHRDNREAAEEEIKRQFDVILNGEFSESELAAAKKSLQHYLRQIDDSPSALDSFYYSRIIAQNSDTVENLSKAIEDVTKKAVIEEARGFSPHTVYFLKGTLNEEACDDEEN